LFELWGHVTPHLPLESTFWQMAHELVHVIELFPDWPDEQFPLYAFHLSRHVPPAKVRAFLDFVVRSVAGN
jgi:DNA-binding transcriptional LysR family regulator